MKQKLRSLLKFNKFVVNEPSAAVRIVKCNLYSTAKEILPDINKTTRISVFPL